MRNAAATLLLLLSVACSEGPDDSENLPDSGFSEDRAGNLTTPEIQPGLMCAPELYNFFRMQSQTPGFTQCERICAMTAMECMIDERNIGCGLAQLDCKLDAIVCVTEECRF